MSKHRRVLVLAAMVAAMNLASMTAIAQAQPPDGVDQFRRGERASQDDSTPGEAVEEFRRGERASQAQPAATANRPSVAQQRRWYYESTRVQPPAPQAPAPMQPAQPTRQPGWLVVSLGLLAATLAVVAGLAMLAARRATRRARIGPAT
jgi:hypothetical protein